MSNSGCYCLFWPDMFHKTSRKVALAIQNSTEGKPLLKRLQRLFRFTRGPWSTSRFGKTLGEARAALLQALKNGNGLEVAEVYMSGVARDLNRVDGTVDLSDVQTVLKTKAGTAVRANVFRAKVKDFSSTRARSETQATGAAARSIILPRTHARTRAHTHPLKLPREEPDSSSKSSSWQLKCFCRVQQLLLVAVWLPPTDLNRETPRSNNSSRGGRKGYSSITCTVFFPCP